ncbi:MAG: hypothetical protein GX352_03010 [Clostridiales bacterium]|nr:hypothetical protein [Clostridiales bacterium]
MRERLRKYINRKFLLYPKTRDILEVREELYTIVLDRYNDCLHSGMAEVESYKKAIEIMADFREAIKEIERGSSLASLKRNLISAVLFSAFYFITLTLIYLFISMVILKTFENTWLIAVAGAFIYLIYFSTSIYRYAKLFSFKPMTRLGLGLIYFSLIPVFYIFPCLYLYTVRSINIWGKGWISVLILGFLWMLTDYLVYRRGMSRFQKDIQILLLGLILTTILYLSISMLFGLWGVAWISYVVFLAAVSLGYYLSGRTNKD